MYITSILLFTTLSSAQGAFKRVPSAETVTSLWIPGTDTQPLVAAVLGSDTLATTYAVQCKPGTDGSECGIDGGITLTEGPKTAAYTMSIGYDTSGSSVLAFTANIQCSLDGTTAAVCTESFGGEEANDPGMSTTTYTGTDFSYQPVTLADSISITQLGGSAAGSDALTSTPAIASRTSGSVAKTTSAASTTGTSKPASSTSTGSTSGPSKSGGTGSAASASPSSSSSTAGAAQAMITRKAEWAIGGAAVAFALL